MVGQQQRRLAPATRALRARAERIRRQELARRARRLRGLNAPQQAALDELTRRLVERLLHHPVTRCTQLAAGPDGHRYVALLQALFGLEQEPSSSVHPPSQGALTPATEYRDADVLDPGDPRGSLAATALAGTPAAGPDPGRRRQPGG
jgi:hypothetical protein